MVHAQYLKKYIQKVILFKIDFLILEKFSIIETCEIFVEIFPYLERDLIE